ncbi:MAG TPA: S-methyl-5-thioribose-1-phosphate isomerase [Candidatus Omnitrophota bacterium]|nr:S-methyl-5-thioribose-1-phosphate isomerase [Candidatus Omnitrophota bacterium]HQO57203.1 S-methyl-5-thioribose-1-phosphate isomerase [Candidatus Omnitrophota bacterium]
MAVTTIQWVKDHIKLIDQTRLPQEAVYIDCYDLKTLWDAIRRLSVRGAPALGVAAGFGVMLGLKDFQGTHKDAFVRQLKTVCDYIATSRPTAVNLFHVLDRMQAVVEQNPDAGVPEWKRRLKQEAFRVYEEDRQVCRSLGRWGASLIPDGGNVMTICNAGALATVDYGTALGVFYSAQEQGKNFSVYACETRPLLQGARLTAWELTKAKIDTTLICDSMAATVMRDKPIAAVFTGADRITANGDTANKIGTYSLAVLAHHHKIPFYVVAPQSTFDLSLPDGRKIPIEERDASEVRGFNGQLSAPRHVKVFNPAFDVTGHRLITAIITEHGIIRPPFTRNISRVLGKKPKG